MWPGALHESPSKNSRERGRYPTNWLGIKGESERYREFPSRKLRRGGVPNEVDQRNEQRETITLLISLDHLNGAEDSSLQRRVIKSSNRWQAQRGLPLDGSPEFYDRISPDQWTSPSVKRVVARSERDA